MQDLYFSEANSDQIPDIVDIHNSHVLNREVPNPDGFLLCHTDREEIQRNLRDSKQYFVAVNPAEKVLGFILLSQPKISEQIIQELAWKENNFIEKIMNKNHIFINIISTHKDYMGQGIGKFMYESIFAKLPASFLSAFIVAKPIANERSLIFHEKQGFQKIAILKKDSFLDFKNYESILMGKEIL